tara:strand:+ start:14 stop:448 length:435 start_codon:yes stop_codon:yes gene_type:complete
MKLRLNKSLHLILNIISPIIFGFFIYIVYRSNNIIVFDWLYYFDIEMIINSPRVSNVFHLDIPFWFKYNLPDGLWIYSLINIFLLIWIDNINKYNFYYIYIFVLIACICEIFQFYNIIPGTYDFVDILFYLFFGFLPFLFVSNK